mmetsp:Transcript_35338/g.31798  ORF Transcript_35338/g.31798 Transcript_35338/m.31798 type:complete len:94 (+) Transcript_35338:2857-3138(+)
MPVFAETKIEKKVKKNAPTPTTNGETSTAKSSMANSSFLNPSELSKDRSSANGEGRVGCFTKFLNLFKPKPKQKIVLNGDEGTVEGDYTLMKE